MVVALIRVPDWNASNNNGVALSVTTVYLPWNRRIHNLKKGIVDHPAEIQPSSRLMQNRQIRSSFSNETKDSQPLDFCCTILAASR